MWGSLYGITSSTLASLDVDTRLWTRTSKQDSPVRMAEGKSQCLRRIVRCEANPGRYCFVNEIYRLNQVKRRIIKRKYKLCIEMFFIIEEIQDDLPSYVLVWAPWFSTSQIRSNLNWRPCRVMPQGLAVQFHSKRGRPSWRHLCYAWPALYAHSYFITIVSSTLASLVKQRRNIKIKTKKIAS